MAGVPPTHSLRVQRRIGGANLLAVMATPQTTLKAEGGLAIISLDYKPLNALHPQREPDACTGKPCSHTVALLQR